MRPEITERIYRFLTYQEVDRAPDIEFGYWPQTIRRWSKEGLPLVLTDDEKNQMFLGKLDEFFRFDSYGHGLPGFMHMNPAFIEETLGRSGDVTTLRGRDGIVAERYMSDVEESSIPHFVEFPVKTPEDWRAMKRRYRLDDSTRLFRDRDIESARAAMSEGKMIQVFFVGFYGQLRNWMGMENLSYAFYDHPAMIHDMVDHWSRLCVSGIERLPEDIPIDYVSWWEDMAGKNGPLVSPTVFREFLQPGYRRVMDAARKRGCVLAHVDCDGNPHDIVANWLEEGVNVMFPLEAQAGVDPIAWRKEFGRELRFRGGLNKYALVEGGRAIDAEFERIRPLFEEGGFIPHLDHLVPPDVPYDHYCDYLDKKRRFIGR
jgi:hypothetical protein